MPPQITLLSGPNPTNQDLDELFFARRALFLLKKRLGREGVKSLLAEDIAAGDAWWTDAVSSSQGKYLRASVTLRCEGLSVSEFLAWWKSKLTDLDVMLGAHPEHYINGHEVLETVGTHVSLFDLRFHEDGPPGFVKESGALDEKRYPVVVSADGVLKNGLVIASACHQFGDVDGGGMEVCVGGWLPEAVGMEVVEMQRRHLAVEWGNWIRGCWEELKGGGKGE